MTIDSQGRWVLDGSDDNSAKHHNGHVHRYYRWLGWCSEKENQPMSAFFFRAWAERELTGDYR